MEGAMFRSGPVAEESGFFVKEGLLEFGIVALCDTRKFLSFVHLAKNHCKIRHIGHRFIVLWF
jgi:hypothetical protein